MTLIVQDMILAVPETSGTTLERVLLKLLVNLHVRKERAESV